jgi:hypothetical protein
MSNNRKKLYVKNDVPFSTLELKYGFFYHAPTMNYWYVMNKATRNENNVEVSLRVDKHTKEIRLYVTNDHKKLPSIYAKKYNPHNYLEFEESLDQFSFADFVALNQVFRLIYDEIVEYR